MPPRIDVGAIGAARAKAASSATSDELDDLLYSPRVRPRPEPAPAAAPEAPPAPAPAPEAPIIAAPPARQAPEARPRRPAAGPARRPSTPALADYAFAADRLVQVSLQLPEEAHRALREEAARRGSLRLMSEIVRERLARYLEGLAALPAGELPARLAALRTPERRGAAGRSVAYQLERGQRERLLEMAARHEVPMSEVVIAAIAATA